MERELLQLLPQNSGTNFQSQFASHRLLTFSNPDLRHISSPHVFINNTVRFYMIMHYIVCYWSSPNYAYGSKMTMILLRVLVLVTSPLLGATLCAGHTFWIYIFLSFCMLVFTLYAVMCRSHWHFYYVSCVDYIVYFHVDFVLIVNACCRVILWMVLF